MVCIMCFVLVLFVCDKLHCVGIAVDFAFDNLYNVVLHLLW